MMFIWHVSKKWFSLLYEKDIYIRITEFSIDDFDDMMWHFKDNSE